MNYESLFSNSTLDSTDKLLSGLQEAENILRYSFHLHKGFEFDDLKNCNDNYIGIIDELFERIWSECSVFTNGEDFNFFGYKGSVLDKKEDLSHLSVDGFFWKKIVKQHVIINAFVILRTLIGDCYQLGDSERVRLSNYTNNANETFDQIKHGFDYILKYNTNHTNSFHAILTKESSAFNGISKPIIKYYDKKTTKIASNPYQKLNASAISSNSKNFADRCKSLEKSLCKFGFYERIIPQFLVTSEKKKSYNTYKNPATLELFDFLVYHYNKLESDATTNLGINGVLSAYNSKTYSFYIHERYLTEIQTLLKDINFRELDTFIEPHKDSNHKLKTSDKIYLRYQIETLLAPVTINCLYQNILPTKGEVFDLTEPQTINFLASCLELPNVFTRQYILQMSIDTITKHFNSDFEETDFFTSKLQSSKSLATFIDTKYSALNNYTKLNTLLTQYKNMMNYLVQIFFPLFENYFFCSLWNYLNTTDDIWDCIIKMYERLSKYLNSKRILNDLFNHDTLFYQNFWESNKKHVKTKKLRNRNNFKKHKNETKKNVTPTIIKPSFSFVNDDITPIDIYHHCINAHKLTLLNNNHFVPTFLSLKYLTKITGKLASDDIQNYYILSSSINKR